MEEEYDYESAAELYELVPFLQAFPFDDYEIVLEKDSFDPEKMGISPIILSQVQGLESPEMINFYFVDGETQAMVTLYTQDLLYLQEISGEVEKLNSTNESLTKGISSNSLQQKIESIKQNLEFVEEIGFNFVGSGIFVSLLDDLLEVHGLDMPAKTRTLVRTLSSKVNENRFTADELKVVTSYYNFLLNHMRILLGIVIAAKIY